MGQARKTQLAFCLTNRCDMRCSYCYTGNAKFHPVWRDINVRFAKRALIDYAQVHRPLGLRFYAVGEPTMNFAAMQELAHAAREIDFSASFELQSNGQFEESIAEWVTEMCGDVWLSLDGPPTINDALRRRLDCRTASEVLRRNVQALRRNPKLRIGGRATITPLNINRMKEIVDYYLEIGLHHGYSRPQFAIQGTTLSPRGKRIDVVGLKQYAERYVEAYKYSQSKGFFFGSFLSLNFDEPVERFCRACHALPYVTLDGYLSVCDEAYYYREDLKDLFIGKYDDANDKIDYWPENISRLRSRTGSNIEACRQCAVRDNCAGHCLAGCAFEHRDIFHVREDVCEAVRYLAQHLPRNEKLFPTYFP